VLGLIEQECVTVTPEVKQAVWTALQSLGAAPVAQRTLTGLAALLQVPELRQALEPYTLAGPYGALLDTDEDNLEAGDMLCFEMDALMQDKRLAAPVLAHLFAKLEARFDGRPTLLILDEAWLFLDHPMFARKSPRLAEDASQEERVRCVCDAEPVGHCEQARLRQASSKARRPASSSPMRGPRNPRSAQPMRVLASTRGRSN
jgi:hypothetical protein